MPKYTSPVPDAHPPRSSRGRIIQLLQLVEDSQYPVAADALLATGNHEFAWGIGPRQIARDLQTLKAEGRVEAVPDPEGSGRLWRAKPRREDVPRTLLAILVAMAERFGVPLELLPPLPEEAGALVQRARERARMVAAADPQLRYIERLYALDNRPFRQPAPGSLHAVRDALRGGNCLAVTRASAPGLVTLEPHAVVLARGFLWVVSIDPRQPGEPLVFRLDDLDAASEVENPVRTRFNASDFIANDVLRWIDAPAGPHALAVSAMGCGLVGMPAAQDA